MKGLNAARAENARTDAASTPTALGSRDAALLVMRADMASGSATQRSLGVMYAFVMAGSSCAAPGFWRPINEAIIAYGKSTRRNHFTYLEGVKKVAWSIFETAGKEQAGAAEGLGGGVIAGANT